MDSIRRIQWSNAQHQKCNWCQAPGTYWDHVAGRACCPDCEEALAAGVAPPLIARTERQRCSVCHRLGTVPFLTFPLHVTGAVALDLCPEHFRALLGRSLGPAAFLQLRRQLHALGLKADQLFLLHEVFYNEHGQALQPVLQPGD